MKKYLSFFRLRFSMGLQYRAAALAGIVTQFAWGGLEILVYRAFYREGAAVFPMSLSATCTYVWMQQAFLCLFAAWMMENEIFEGIRTGNVLYELCRPIDLYGMWFGRSLANRVSRAVLRSIPILIFAACLPEPYGIRLPVSGRAALLFAVSMVLAVLVTVGFGMVIYAVTFFTVSPDGMRIFCTSAVEFLAGAIIPIPFFPEGWQRVLELLPFGSMQNVPLRLYSGSIAGNEAVRAVGIQCFWVLALMSIGKMLFFLARKKMILQGG